MCSRTAFFLPLAIVLIAGLVPFTSAKAHDDACRSLHEAVFLDEPEDVMALIQKGVDVNCLDRLRHTPIITAANGASLESFTILLRHGAKINVKDEWGMTLIRHIQQNIEKFSIRGGGTYRRIYQRMADMVEDGDSIN